VATKSSDSLSQETSKLISLTYSDANNDPAISCRVTSETVEIQMISPILFDGTLFASIDSLYDAFVSLTVEVNRAVPGLNFSIDLASATAARSLIKKSFVHQTILDNLAIFRVAIENILNSANLQYSSNLYPTVVPSYLLTTSRLAQFRPLQSFMNNHCACASGVCSSYAVSKIRKNGTAGFSYSITDKDGESALKAVSLTVQAMSFASAPQYAPTAQGLPTTFDLNESATSTPEISLQRQLPPVLGDYFVGLSSPTFRISSPAAKGNASCTSTGLCTYTPTSGNDNSVSPVVLPAASSATGTISGIKYDALALGSAGNNIKINFYDLHANNIFADVKSSPIENFGLVNNSVYEGYVRVTGSIISVFVNVGVTTLTQVKNLIMGDPKANKLITATLTAVDAGAAITVLPSNGALAGGVDDYDKFSYIVNNGYADSAPVDVIVHIFPIDDKPIEATPFINVTTTPAILLEDAGAFSINLNGTYTDVDTVPSTCRLDPLDTNISSGQFAVAAPLLECSCAAGACQINLKAKDHLNGALFTFNYQIESIAGLGNWSLPIARTIAILPVNDFPYTTGVALSTTDLSTGAITLVPATTENSLVASATGLSPVRVAYVSPDPTNIAKIAGVLTPITVDENTSISEKTVTMTLTTAPGGGSDELAQTVTITNIVSSNPTLINPAIPAAGSKTIDISPALNISGTATLTITLMDNGGAINSNGEVNVDTSTQTILITVIPKNDYPFFGNSDCAFNRRSNSANHCSLISDPLNAAINCVGISSPVTAIKPSATGTLYWDAANSRCYKAIGTAPSLSWIEQAMIPDLVETNEGGESQVDLTIDEDKANTADEDIQQITLVSVVSDNQALLPNDRVNSIKTFYDLNDNGIEDAGEHKIDGDMLDVAGAIDSRKHKLFIKLKPVGGVSGNANVTITVRDNGVSGSPAAADPKTTQKTFSFVVHPIAALHGGWVNIAAAGIKTDKSGAPVSFPDVKCNYNTTADLNACTDGNGTPQSCVSSASPLGTTSPHGVIIPQAANVIFLDAANNKCYRAQDPPNKYSWIEMNTACPITRYSATTCPISEPSWNTVTAPSATSAGQYYYNPTSKICFISGGVGTALWTQAAFQENWITTTLAPTVPTPTAIGQYYYDTNLKSCYISTAIGAGNWTKYVPSKVTLEWNAFNLVGTGADVSAQISGWNVYRREMNLDYNFKSGFLKDSQSSATMSITNSMTRKFTDTTAIAGKVYFYTVRPIDNVRQFATYTPEVFSEVRVLAPPENYSFVHRWTVNQEICNSMNMTTATANKVDPTHNYRCPYYGPGETVIAGVHFYDYGHDLLVDISEAGCPYSDATVAGCGNNGCIGIGAPTITPVDGSIYYDRSSGICYVKAGAWAPYTGTAIAQISNSALNPPMSNISAAQATAACTNRAVPALIAPAGAVLAAVKLPEKKDYMAYSAPPTGMIDGDISALEQGFELNIKSRCNGSNASGLIGFTDSIIPSSPYMYSVAGTAASGIKSLFTGSVPLVGISSSTESCVSRSGVQDVYGNVAEWVQDSMSCAVAGAAGAYTCTATSPTLMAYNFGTVIFPGSTASGIYGFDDVTGPFFDKNTTIIGPDSLDAFPTEWNYVDRLFNAGFFSFPLGLPIHTDIAARMTFTAPVMPPTLLDVGSGINAYQLHGDGIIVNGAAVAAGVSGTGHFAVGGSYLSGLRSGRFSMELIPDGATSMRPDIGFRCVVPVTSYGADSLHTYAY
jgi:hypothetical protein